MRASRTHNILNADAVANAESTTALTAMVRLMHFSGVCVVGMHENAQPRNLGGPIYSCKGINMRNGMQVCYEDRWEVRWLHSTEEVR